jgi:hypothetical protein
MEMFLIFVGLPMSLAITTRWSRNFFVHLWVVYLYKVHFWFCCHLLACLYIVHDTNGWSRKMLNCCSVILLCHPSMNKYEHKKAACHKVWVQDKLSHDLNPTCYSAARNVQRQWAAIESKIIQLQTFLFRKFRSLQYPTTIRCCIDTIPSPMTLDLLCVHSHMSYI